MFQILSTNYSSYFTKKQQFTINIWNQHSFSHLIINAYPHIELIKYYSQYFLLYKLNLMYFLKFRLILTMNFKLFVV